MQTEAKKIFGVMTVLGMAVFMGSMEATAVYVILKSMAHDLGVSALSISWVVTLYLLFFGSFIVLSGRLGDHFGHKRALLVGVVLFGCASALGGWSNSLVLILIARVGQGLGGSIMWPNVMALSFSAMPEKHKALGMGIISGMIGFGMAAGPVFAGIISTFDTWRWVFWINIPLSIVVLLGVWRWIENKAVHTVKLDWMGAIWLVLALGGVALVLNQLPGEAVLHDWVWLIGVVSVVFVGFFIWNNQARDEPIVAHALIKNKTFMLSCLLRSLTVSPYYMTMFIAGYVLQHVEHVSVLQSGLIFLPMTLVIGSLSPIAGKWVAKVGARQLLLLGAMSYLMGVIVLFDSAVMMHLLLLSVLLGFMGLGFAVASPSTMTMGLSAAGEQYRGAAGGIFYMVSVMSGLLAVAVCSALLVAFPIQALHIMWGLCAVLAVGVIALSWK